MRTKLDVVYIRVHTYVECVTSFDQYQYECELFMQLLWKLLEIESHWSHEIG